MPLMRQDAPLTMEWCLSCHRDPGPCLQPPEEIYRALAPAQEHHPDRAEAEALMARYGIDAEGLTDCSVCHR